MFHRSFPCASLMLTLLASCQGGSGGDSTQGGSGEDSAGNSGTLTDGGGSSTGDTASDGGAQTIPGQAAPWLRQETQAPGSVTFTEIQYHPAADGTEWIELYNPMVLDMDMSGWSLQGAISYAFAEGTVVAAGGTLVVAADPTAMQDETGYADALGPFDGSLSNSGERLDLVNNAGRLIDTLGYGDDDPWPVGPDGSGFTLAKIQPDAASDHAENWTVSTERGGTPGAANLLDPLLPPTQQTLVPEDATWAYDLSGAYPAADWALLSYDDSAWASGVAPFYAGASTSDVLATAWVTADNEFAAYLGKADGTDLRLVGWDTDGSWTTVEDFDVDLTPDDHLLLAAWELSGDSTSPQMVIGEVDLPDDTVGTNADNFEWVLGPTGADPGALPANDPPTEDAIAALIADADAAGSWDLPAVEASRDSSPWGSSVSGSFSDAANYIWGDTFDSDSTTNDEDTYALFRSIDPVVAPRGDTELSSIPTMATFRTVFDFDADPAATTLHLDCKLDDGAIVTLNGVELLRNNLPDGDVDATTLASASVDDPTEVSADISADISADALVSGTNILAAELHQALPKDGDLAFGCTLTAEVQHTVGERTVVFNEIPDGWASPFWVELLDASASTQDTKDLVLASSTGDDVVLGEGRMKPGALSVVDELGFSPEAGDVLYLYSADRGNLLDSVRVKDAPRARAEGDGPWRVPSEATPGEPNAITLHEDVVINEIQYHHDNEEWIELFNRGETEVDLGGWQIVDAVAYTFPTGTVLGPGGYLLVSGDAAILGAKYPDITVLGDFSGHLGNDGDRILVLDAAGNPADDLRYYTGGRWPEAADGGGSSLELRDPWADNAVAEAWAASDERDRVGWQTISYRGVADTSAVGPDGVWNELDLGLLDSGEVLIDDLSVIQDPDTKPVQLVQDGAFDDIDSDGQPLHWRLLGDHRHSQVVSDPLDPSDNVLDLVATGPTEHMHNHVETTLLQPISQTDYEISYRARWVSGSNQLNTRLYFNRLPHTELLDMPDQSGTPGAANSALEEDIGPTMSNLRQDVVLPAADEPVTVSVDVGDPDGVAAVTLWSSFDGGDWSSTVMTEGTAGTWSATLPGQVAGSIVQIYVEAEDGGGLSATIPAQGPDSHALYTVDDGNTASTGLHTLRILMTPDDSDWLHTDINMMSNDYLGATVVYDESQVYYDVGVRLKGSERGRPIDLRLGYGLRFHPEQPFRGSHTSVLIDRSEGVGFGQREVLMNLVMTHAGSVFGEYNDLIQLIAPVSTYTGSAELQLDRFSNLVLAAQFADGDKGTRFKYELVYYPTTTQDGTAEGYKLPQPDSVVGTALTDLGDDKEAYRWNFIIENNTREDDYDSIIGLCQTFGGSGADLPAEAGDIIDVDEWMRAFAFATLSGATDNYGAVGSEHNAQFYQRPEDGKMLYFPHDLDYIGSATQGVAGNGDLARLLEDPADRRAYYGHLQDIISRAYNPDYLAPWCSQLGALLPGQDFESHCQFVADRQAYVLDDAADAVTAVYPEVDFQITTEGGADFSVTTPELTLQGQAWVDVRDISLDGATDPLLVTWAYDGTWQLTVPLAAGANDLILVATDLHGVVVGTDEIIVTYDKGS